MDKEILPNSCVSGRKPQILPKPKIIPEKPRFKTKINVPPNSDDSSVAHPQSPTKLIDNQSSSRLDEIAVQSPISSPNDSPQHILDVRNSTCDNSSCVEDEVVISDGNKPSEKSFFCQDNQLFNQKPVDDFPNVLHVPQDLLPQITETLCRIDEAIGENGDQSDSDGQSVHSVKSVLGVNTSYDKSIICSNTSIDQYDSFTSESKDNPAFMIAKEFMTTEQAYVQALRLLVVDFKKHLEGYDYTSGEYDKVVSSLPQLLEFHEGLLADLEQRVSDWTAWYQIADVIVKKGPFLKLYSSYMRDFELQQLALADCSIKSVRFSQALQDFESSDVCKRLNLKHYMLKPVQRIPQYRLLLERYLSHLDSGSADYKNAETALAIVQEVLIHANSTIKQSDNLSTLLKLQSRLGNYEIIKPGRSFIKEGELQKLSRKEIQPRYFILLSDCLLYTLYSASSSYLRIKYELPLSGMRVWSAEDCTEFDVRTSTRSFTLKAKNEDECAEWMTSLQLAILENNKRQRTFTNQIMTTSLTNDSFVHGKEAPVWVQDKKTTMCQICTAEFTVTFRRHHCRCCGRVVCGVCSNNRAPLQYQNFHAKRVCDECFNHLKDEFDDPNGNIINCIRKQLNLDESDTTYTFDILKASFKRFDSSKKPRKTIPKWRTEVTGNVTGCQMSGWLEAKGKRGWKRFWFILKDQVLYYYKASCDVMAFKTLPVLGYKIDQPSDSIDEMDKCTLFRLTHDNQIPLLFLAPSVQQADLWISALNEATILK